jgi:hypothetical protein
VSTANMLAFVIAVLCPWGYVIGNCHK